MAVGAKTILITKAIMVITFPLAFPVSKILVINCKYKFIKEIIINSLIILKDVLLGEEIGNVYNRDRLKELVRVSTKISKIDLIHETCSVKIVDIMGMALENMQLWRHILATFKDRRSENHE